MTGTKVPAVSRNARGARTNSEEFLFTYPDILDVQVIGVPDLKYGEESMAWVRLLTVTGKVQKCLLRAKAVELLGLQHAADVETA